MWSWAHYEQSCWLVCVSICLSRAHRRMAHTHAIYDNILQIDPKCVFTIALRVIHVFKHCATSIGDAFISKSRIRGQVSESARARSVTKCELTNTSLEHGYS